MAQVTIYHNPRCSKSRQTLALLREHDIEPRVVEYLKAPLEEGTLQAIVAKLGVEPAALIRKKESDALGLPNTEDPQQLIQRMAAHPEIIQRPIVVCGNQARLGRPPEDVLAILP